MSSSTFFLVCLQALLIVQTVYSQYLGPLGPRGLSFEAEAVSTGRGGIGGYANNYGLINGYGRGPSGLVGADLGLGYGLGYGNSLAYNGLGYGNGLAYNGLGYGNGLAYGGLGYGADIAVGYGPGYGAGVPNVAATASIPVTGPFASTGAAELAVGGEFGVGGSTVVGGQLPVIGAVSFGGAIPASGVVSIAGECGCARVPL